MSSAAYFTAKKSIPLTEWLAFCEIYDIEYSPNTIGWNVFYQDSVEVTFGEQGTKPLWVGPKEGGHYDWETAEPPPSAKRITISTYFGGEAIPDVAKLARKIAKRWPGTLGADPEIEIRL